MLKTYTYDPMQITAGSKDQMRFELGDTAVEGGEQTCALCDEEYTAIIQSATAAGKSFGFAKYKCVQAIVMKLGFEVDFSAGGMSLSLSQRYERWKELYNHMKKQYKNQSIAANPAALGLGDNALDSGHYFYRGMNDNPRAAHAAFPFLEERGGA